MSKKNKRSPFLRGLIIVGGFISICILGLLLLLGYLSVREYKPQAQEEVEITGTGTSTLSVGDSLSVLSFNIGYGALDKDHDFFMDGGETVTVESADIIQENMAGIISTINEANADVVFLQEVDVEAKRSYGINEAEMLRDSFLGTSAFATNFLCDFIPYPLPEMIGKVNSGILTLSRFGAESATRIALPTSFKWPVRLCQLKRALLVQRIPLEGSDKELVIINVHLEAYDDGSGKAKQTEILTQLLMEEYEKGNYCIAGGDFNQNFPTVDPNLYPVYDDTYFEAGTLEADILPEGWTFATDATTPTSRLLSGPYDQTNPETQYYVIDGYILSPNIVVEEVETLDKGFTYSDHNPVKLKVTLAE